MHTTLKKAELLKHSKLDKNAPPVCLESWPYFHI